MNKVIYVKQHNNKKIFNPSTVFSYQMLKPVFSYIDTTKSPHGYQDQSMKKWFYLKPKISSLPDRREINQWTNHVTLRGLDGHGIFRL